MNRGSLHIAKTVAKVPGVTGVAPAIMVQGIIENDKEQTFKWLQMAYDDRAVWMSYLAVDPVFDGFSSDLRFQDLLRRIHLLP